MQVFLSQSEVSGSEVSAEVAPKAAKKKAAKKAPAKKAAKKTAKAAKPAKKAAKKADKAPRARKEGLRNPQVRILKALSKGKSLTRAEIAEKAPVDVATCVEYIGSHDDAKRIANDKKHFPSLLTLKYVKAEQHDEGGHDVVRYAITAAGKAALAKAE